MIVSNELMERIVSRNDLSFNGAMNPKNEDIPEKDRLEVVFDYIVLSKE